MATHTPRTSQAFSIASLVLGIVSLLNLIFWFVSLPLGILAIIFGILGLKTAGRGKAIAGIITGGLGALISLLIFAIVIVALPSLQSAQRDTARKSELSGMAADIVTYQTNNQGLLPVASDVPRDSLDVLEDDSVLYTPGIDCDGNKGSRFYSLEIVLENGTNYCVGS